MLATGNFRDWHAIFGEVTCSSLLKTMMDCHSELVLHSLGNNQPVQVVVHQRRQTALIFPGPSDQASEPAHFYDLTHNRSFSSRVFLQAFVCGRLDYCNSLLYGAFDGLMP